MAFTFSVGLAPDYVELGGQFDIARGMDVVYAACLTAQAHPGGVARLARDMGIKAGTLQHKLNLNNETHQLTLPEAVRLQVITGNFSILHAMAHQLGCEVRRAVPDQSGGDPVEAFMRFQTEVAEVTRAAADAHRQPSRNAVRRLDRQVQELIVVAQHLAGAAARLLPAEEGERNAN